MPASDIDTSIPRAQYLLRVDDLCPTVAARRWRRFVEFIREFELKPILAIVPDNLDPALEQSPPDPAFWEQMRALESCGASIALHGYRHVCASAGRSLVPLSRRSEFAGVPEATQRAWIGEGLRILRGHGLEPRLWAAPRHGFDAATLRALQAEDIMTLSDGFARRPFLRAGVAWIPQQLWAPCEKQQGLWTICIHPNTAGEQDIEDLQCFLRDRAAQFISIDRALADFQPRLLGTAERAFAQLALWRVQARNLRKGN